jgi:deoxyribose-phosphate aldolase
MAHPPLASYIDHTLLKAEATSAQVERLCAEALEHGFASVCVNSRFVRLVADALGAGPVAVCSVIGFPLGAMGTCAKEAEARCAVLDGARELDMVISLGAAKAGEWDEVSRDVAAVVRVAAEAWAEVGGAPVGEAGAGGAEAPTPARVVAGGAVTSGAPTPARPGVLVKAIIECCLLDDAEKRAACEAAVHAGAAFVKTSTGFLGGGATVADVRLMRQVVGERAGVKASGGIRTATDALRMVEAGATRIGTSNGVAIVRDV